MNGHHHRVLPGQANPGGTQGVHLVDHDGGAQHRQAVAQGRREDKAVDEWGDQVILIVGPPPYVVEGAIRGNGGGGPLVLKRFRAIE